MSIPSISAGAREMSDAKLFEAECWEALSRMDGMTLRPQGRCIRYQHENREFACPDIVGSYQEGVGRWRRGFVVDCKLYGDRRQIDRDDVDKLLRDRNAARNALVGQGLIGGGQEVTGIFLSTTDGIVANHEPLQLIKINYDGGLGGGWERSLQRKFKDIIR